jgi:hypothetical protein
VTRTLSDVAELVRSKNAGPFWLTIDIFCGDSSTYELILASSVTDPAYLATTLNVELGAIRVFTLPNLNALKITIPRPQVQGSIWDTDLHAGQQFVALLYTPVPELSL